MNHGLIKKKHYISESFVPRLMDSLIIQDPVSAKGAFNSNEKSTVSATVDISTALTLSCNHPANIHYECTNIFIAKNVCFRLKINYIHSLKNFLETFPLAMYTISTLLLL